jgi:hypothetical protein
MNRAVAAIASLALSAVFLFGIAFIWLSWPWNLVPLILLALSLLALWTRLRSSPPPEDDAPSGPQEDAAEEHGHWSRRASRAFGPVVAGMILDVVDLATFGPIGLFLGLPLGGLAGYWLGSALGLSRKARLGCALAGGVYCTIPGTEFIPLGTLVGAFARFRESGKRPRRRRRPPRRTRSTGKAPAPEND